MTLCVLLYPRIVMKINHLCLELMNQCCLFLYSLLCYYVLYFIMLYGRFLICYYVMFLSYVVSDLACVGHGHLCFVFSCHHCFHFYSCCGTRKLYGKDGEYFFFLYGFVFNIMECRGKLFDLIIGILLGNVFWEFF